MNLLHLLALLLPLHFAHLALPAEELLVGFPVAAAQTIPNGGELAVIIIEVEMVHRVAGGAVEDLRVGHVFAVVCGDQLGWGIFGDGIRGRLAGLGRGGATYGS